MKFVTFNIRCDFGQDGENCFCYRKPLIQRAIAQGQPDVICFQEVLPHVAAWLKENLTGYTVVGCGRGPALDDEQETIAFRSDRYNLVQMDTYWLSETPRVPASRYPDQSVCPRTCTEALLAEAETGRAFRVANVHLDHVGVEARRLGLRQVLGHLAQAELFPSAPAIVAGDFNVDPDGDELKVFDEFPGYVNATDGVGVTFHGYMRAEDPGSIDYIWLKGGLACDSVEKWTQSENGVYLSDHYPVCAQLRWAED